MVSVSFISVTKSVMNIKILTIYLCAYLGTYQQAKHNIGKALDETDPPFESEVETSTRALPHTKPRKNYSSSESDEEEENTGNANKKPKFSHLWMRIRTLKDLKILSKIRRLHW